MKHSFLPQFLRRTAALLCAVSLAVPTVYAASAKEILQTKIEIVDGLTYYNTVTDTSAGRVESFMLALEEDGDVSPLLVTGDGTVYGSSTISSAVKYAQEQGYHVLGAINTDFFSSASGIPLGIVIQDGVYQSSPEKESAILINEDGEFDLCEEPEVTMTLTNERSGQELELNHLNKLRTASGGLYLLNDDFSSISTRASGSGWYVLMKSVDEEEVLTVDTSMELEVTEMFRYDQPIAIREGEYILTADDKDALGAVYESFQIGDTVTLSTQCSDKTLRKAQWASGCGDILVQDRSVTDSGNWDATLLTRAPRTALGVKKDGTAILYVADGRKSGYSAGLTLSDLAETMKELGCKWAVNLDGGGSSAMSVWVPGQSAPAVQSRPSDGSQRKCASYLLLVTEKTGSGRASRLALTEDGIVVLEGSSVQLPEVAALDRGLELLETQDAEDVKITAKLGDVEDGVYTAGKKSGTDTLKLKSGSISGTATIHVVDALTELTVTEKGSSSSLTALTLTPGDTMELTVTGSYWGRTALRDLNAVEWEIEGGVGSVDENGVFTAADHNAEGSITVSAGDLTAKIAVTVEAEYVEVPAEHWAYEAVKYGNSKGILEGVPEEGFDWDGSITRAQFVLAMYNVLGQPAYSSACDFTDVTESDYYYNALCWGQELGIAGGMGDGTFAPNGSLTREQGFTLLRRALPQLGITCPDASTAILARYGDHASIADWAKSHIATLTIQGLVNGTDVGVLPQGSLTWAQTAALLYRLSSFTPVTADIETAEKTAVCTAGDMLNIRLAPEAGAAVLDHLKGGSTVVITAELEGWYQVLFVNDEGLLVQGYGSADYLQLN